MFRDAPAVATDDLLAWTIEEMDKYGVARAMVQLDDDTKLAQRALTEYPNDSSPILWQIPTTGWRKFARSYA